MNFGSVSVADVIGAATVEVRGDLGPLRDDFSRARAEATRFSRTAGGQTQRAVTDLKRQTEGLGRETKAYNREAMKASVALARWRRESEQSSKSARRQAQDFDRVTGSMTSMTRVAARLGTVIGTALAVRNFIGFEDKMAEVSTLVDTAKISMDELRDAALDSAAAFGGDAADQAQALYQIISAGAQDAAQATDILTASNKLAVGGVTDVATAADGLTTVLNAYGNKAGSTTDISDALFTAMRAGKTTIEELSSSLGVVAPLAAQTGVNFDELVAAASALTKGGISTRESMTGLRAILAAVAKPSSEAQKMAKQLGIDFSVAGLQSKGLAGFLQELTAKTHGNTAAMAQLFGGVEALVPILALTGGQADDFASILDDMGKKAGQTEEAVNKMANSPGFQAGRVWSTLQKEVFGAADAFSGALTEALKFTADNMDTLVKVAEVLAGAAIPALAVALGTRLVTAFNVLRAAMLSNPLGLLITVFAAVVSAAYVFRHELAGVFATVLGYVEKFVNSAIDFLNLLIMPLNSIAGYLGKPDLLKIGHVDMSGTIKSLRDFSQEGKKAGTAITDLNYQAKKAAEGEGQLGGALGETTDKLTDAQKEAKKLADQRKDAVKDLQNEIALLQQLLPLASQLGTSEADLAEARERIATLQKLQLSQNSTEGKQIADLIAKRRQLNQELAVQKEIGDRRDEISVLREVAPLYGDLSKSLEDIADQREWLNTVTRLGIDQNSDEARTIRDLIAERRKLNEEEAKRSLRDDAKARITDLENQARVVGMTRAETAAFETQQELLNYAIDNGIKLTPQLVDEINRYAEQVGVATGKLAEMERQQAAIEAGSEFFRDNLSKSIEDLVFAGESLSDTFKNLALVIAKAALQAALFGQGPLGGLLGGKSGGGLLGGIFGGSEGGGGALGGVLAGVFHSGTPYASSGGTQRSVPAQTFINAPRFHDGLRPGEFPAILEEGEEVIPRNKRGQRGQSSGVTINQNVYPRDYDSFRRTQRQQNRKLKQELG